MKDTMICPSGYYCKETTDDNGTPCPAGKGGRNGGREGRDDTMICPSGYYCKESTEDNGTPCPAGKGK